MSNADFQNGFALGLAVKLSAYTPVKSLVDQLYEHYGVDKTVYPYVFLKMNAGGYMDVYFTEYCTSNRIGGATKRVLFSKQVTVDLTTFPESTDYASVVAFFIESVPIGFTERKDYLTWNSFDTWWTNAEQFVGDKYMAGLYYIV